MDLWTLFQKNNLVSKRTKQRYKWQWNNWKNSSLKLKRWRIRRNGAKLSKYWRSLRYLMLPLTALRLQMLRSFWGSWLLVLIVILFILISSYYKLLRPLLGVCCRCGVTGDGRSICARVRRGIIKVSLVGSLKYKRLSACLRMKIRKRKRGCKDLFKDQQLKEAKKENILKSQMKISKRH